MDLEDQKKEEANGCSVIVGNTNQLGDVKGKGIETNEPVDHSPPLGKSSPTTKGFGLKKWRRIKREVRKDGESSIDSAKLLLKRGLSNPVANSAKAVHFSAQKSDGSVSSTNAFLGSPGVFVDGFGVIGDSGLAIGPGFLAGTDSDNSEDWSSKSSTAASAPKPRYEVHGVVGYSPDMNQLRSLSGKNLGTSAQRAHQGKGRVETSKKARGERVKIEKENSHSSMESDSRSSNFLFMQGGNYFTSNGTKGGSSMTYDGEFGDEAYNRERPLGEELRAGLGEGNDRESGNMSQGDLAAESPWEVKEEKSEKGGSSTDHDPLLESIVSLQAAQEALEREIQKFKEIGKDVIFGHSLQDIGIPSDDTEFARPSTSEQSRQWGGAQHSLNSLECEVVSLKQDIILLQSKLKEAVGLVKLKEAIVNELEAILGSSSKKEENISEIEMQQLEGLFRQKIEAEVEYLTISRTVQKLRAAAVDQVALLEEQRALASEHARMANRLGNAEARAASLNTQAEKLESFCEDIASTDETVKLQRSLCKYSSYFLIQLVLLAVVLGLFLLQKSPDYAEVVPT